MEQWKADLVETYGAVRDNGAPPEVVEHLRKAKDELFAARVAAGV